MNDQQDIVEALKDLMKSKGIGPQRLASMTDVPKRFIDAILQGDFDKLPARPYIRGYLFKISNVLGAESDSLWQLYRASADSRSSGDGDRLPINRFAIKKLDPGRVIAILLGVLVLLFLGLNWNRIIGKPGLEIISTVPDITDQEILVVEGQINPDDRLTLQGELIYPDEGGNFVTEVQLDSGPNTLEFVVKRYLGREAKIVRQVVYQPPEEPEPAIEPPAEPEPQPENGGEEIPAEQPVENQEDAT